MRITTPLTIAKKILARRAKAKEKHENGAKKHSRESVKEKGKWSVLRV